MGNESDAERKEKQLTFGEQLVVKLKGVLGEGTDVGNVRNLSIAEKDDRVSSGLQINIWPAAKRRVRLRITIEALMFCLMNEERQEEPTERLLAKVTQLFEAYDSTEGMEDDIWVIGKEICPPSPVNTISG